MHAFIADHFVLSCLVVALVTVVVACGLKRLDDWFKARRAFDRLQKFDAATHAIASRRLGR